MMKKISHFTLMMLTSLSIASANATENQENTASCPAGQLKVDVNSNVADAPTTYACVPLPDCGGVIAGKCTQPGHVCVNSAQSTATATATPNHSCVVACGGTQTGVCKTGLTCTNTAAEGQPANYKCSAPAATTTQTSTAAGTNQTPPSSGNTPQ